MALLKQMAAALGVLFLAAFVWLRLDDGAGRALLAEDSLLPDSLRPVISALSRGDDAPRIGATPQDRGPGRRQAAALVVTDPARPDVTRDRLRAVGTGEAEHSVSVYPDAAGIVTQVNFRPGTEVEEGDILAILQNDTERLALDRARIALVAAEQQVARYEALSSSSVTQVQLEEVRRTEETARLDLRAAEIALDRRNIVAPIAGRVGLSAVNVGALVGNQTLIGTIDDRRRLKVMFNVPEAFVSELSLGHALQATPTSRTGKVYSGEVAALDSRLDEASRTLRVEALIDNEADELRPGMSFSIDLSFQGQAFLSVDPLAIQWERSGPFVWVVRDGAAEKSPIRIVERNVERVLLASEDLTAGEAVIVEGVQSVREGMAVRMLAPADPKPARQPSPDVDLPTAEAEPASLSAKPPPSPADQRASIRGGANAAEMAR